MADFDPSASQKSCNNFDKIYPGPQPTRQHFGGVAKRGCSKQLCDLSHL